MLCQRAAEVMERIFDDLATSEERAELQAHLAQCADCRAQWQAFQGVDAVLCAAKVVEPPPALAEGIMQRVQRYRRKQALRYWGRSLAYGLLMALALAAVPVLLLFTLASRNPSMLNLLVEVGMQVGWFLSTLMRVGQLVARAIVERFSVYLMVWVGLAFLVVMGWLRLIASGYLKRVKA